MRMRAAIAGPARAITPQRDQTVDESADRHLACGVGSEIPAATEARVVRQPLDQRQIA